MQRLIGRRHQGLDLSRLAVVQQCQLLEMRRAIVPHHRERNLLQGDVDPLAGIGAEEENIVGLFPPGGMDHHPCVYGVWKF